MMKCPTCHTANIDSSRFCDECGSKLISVQQAAGPQPPAYVPPSASVSMSGTSQETSVDIPPAAFAFEDVAPAQGLAGKRDGSAHAVLVIEKGDAPGTEFRLVNDESTIGRWDADNGVFPDVDLDAFDSDAKVSRRHARIRRSNDAYYIEDLGSTNGTYINRGRRLLPGNTEALKDGDEIIVGKTFLRFQIMH